MSQSDAKEVFIFCDSCKQNVRLKLPAEILDKRVGGLLSVVSVHGTPPHAVVAYIDEQFRVRGIEYPQAALPEEPQVIQEVSEGAVKDLEPHLELGLTGLINSLAEKPKDGVKVLAALMVRAITKRPVFLVHDDPSEGEIALRAVQGLLSDQLLFVTVVNHTQVRGRNLESACVYDLQAKRFMSEGPKVDSKYFEQTIGSLVGQENAYSRLRNELSKIFYSYDRAKQILAQATATVMDTHLASEASIDLMLIPLLLEMAESEGLKLKPKVQQDGLGRAIRSI